jgi:hypothetical protein
MQVIKAPARPCAPAKSTASKCLPAKPQVGPERHECAMMHVWVGHNSSVQQLLALEDGSYRPCRQQCRPLLMLWYNTAAVDH